MFQKCQVRGILPFGAFPMQGISCTIQGQHTQIHLKTHSSPTNIHTLHLYALRHLLQVSQDKSGQQQTPSDSNRHQTTPTDVPRHPKRPFKDVLRFVLTWNGVCWCLLVSYVVWRCEERLWGVFKAYLSAVYGRVYGFVASEGVSECSGLVWCSKCPILEKLGKAKFHAPDTFETSKYQNLPI